MIGILKGLATTFTSHWRRPVTVQYPTERRERPPRFAGFPGLLWDSEVGEPFCTGCQVCQRNCPTDAILVTMKENPLAAEGRSKRRRIVDVFELDISRCIICGTCVEVCNFDAIKLTEHFELGSFRHSDFIKDRDELIEMTGSKRAN